MRLAVVGAGVSGLVVAHLLHRAHDVTMFEANGYAGGHTNTIRVDTPNETHQVDTGAMLLQAITIDDRADEVEKASKSFTNTYIFAGGCLPSLEVITRNVAERTDLQAAGLEKLTAHYVSTLWRWRLNFTAHADELAERGYDERFGRLWTLYFAYCEARFAERRICDMLLLLTKQRSRIASRKYRHRSDHGRQPDLLLSA